MLRLFCFLILLNILMGCSSSEIKPLESPAQISDCQFDKIPSPAYIFKSDAQHNVMSYFFYDPTRYLNQFDAQNYSELVTLPFKVLETGVVSQESLSMRTPSLAKFRMVEEDFNGKVYQRDQSFSSKVITQNCHIYYARGNKFNKKSLKSMLVKADHSQLSEQDLFNFYGREALLEKPLTTTITFDAVENLWRLDSPSYKGLLLQAIVDPETNAVFNLQLYTELQFQGGWGDINSALAHSGEYLDLFHIRKHRDCPLKLTKCIHVESLSVILNLPFLKAHRGGFEILLEGSKSKRLFVPAQMVSSFLDAISKTTQMIPPNRP